MLGALVLVTSSPWPAPLPAGSPLSGPALCAGRGPWTASPGAQRPDPSIAWGTAAGKKPALWVQMQSSGIWVREDTDLKAQLGRAFALGSFRFCDVRKDCAGEKLGCRPCFHLPFLQLPDSTQPRMGGWTFAPRGGAWVHLRPANWKWDPGYHGLLCW